MTDDIQHDDLQKMESATDQCGTEIKQQYIAMDSNLIAENLMLSSLDEPFKIILTLLKGKDALAFAVMDPEKIEQMLVGMVQQVRAMRAAKQRIILVGK